MDPQYMPDSQGTPTPGVVSQPTLSNKPSKKGGKKKIVVILILLLLGLGAAGAYFFVFSEDKAEAPVASQEEPSDGPDEQTETCAEGRTEYNNEDLGIKFCYPAEWGDVSVEAGPEEEAKHLTKGSEKALSFSNNPTVTAGVRSKDWAHNDAGHDGSGTPGHLTIEEAKRAKEYLKPSYIYIDTDDQFAYVDACMEFCSSTPAKVQLSYTFKLVGNETYEVIEFQQDGDAFGDEFWDKAVGGISSQKVDAADLTQLFKKTDSRFVLLQQIADSNQ